MATASVDRRKCVGSVGRSAACSRRMEDTIGRAFLRYQQQPMGGQCLCRDCVGKAKHFTIRVHKMLEVQSLYKPTPPHQPTAKRRRLRLTSVPLVDLRAPPSDGGGHYHDLYESLNSPPRSLISDADAASLSTRSGICSMSDSMDSQKLGTSSIRIKHLTSSWETESRFPKLNECAHFHYDFVELGPIEVCLFDETQENSKMLSNGELDHSENFAVQVSSNGKSWVVRRSYENFHMLDRQLHQCIYDRKFSNLNKIPRDRAGQLDDGCQGALASIKEIYGGLFAEYLLRLSDIAGNLINCGPILNWLELDNRGNRLIVTDDSAINTPAVAAAYVTKRYTAQASDEISFEVGDMISVIDMPPPDESIWWRGKRGFEVGFFPSECVEVIGDKLPHTIHIPKAPTKPVLRKHGKLIAFFRSFILSRPSRRKLKQSGILKERVFGCDLGEHLLNSGHDIPTVLTSCTEFIESHGIVDGIYRLSGVTSNIQKLRNTFDEDRVPDLNDEAILQDIHCVASLLKMYFRELPNPLLTYQLYDKFVSAVQSDDDVKLLSVRDVVQQLPPPHYRTLEFLVKHLSRVAAFGAETGMTPKNVAIVWAPNLLRSKDLEVGGVAALQVVGVQAVVTEYLIHYSDLIFNDKMPVFPPCPGSGGTPRRSRPKSLAISTPTKLLSLEEARSRALGTGMQHSQKYIEVGGGPSTLPSKYHTVIDLPDRKRGSTKNKKSPSGWKSFFSKGKSSSQSTRERDKKTRRKGSTTPSDPGTSLGLTGTAITETDGTRNNNRLRSVKSAESLATSSTTNSNRNSNVAELGNILIPGRTGRHSSRLGECIGGSEEELSQAAAAASTRLSEAASSAQLRLSPHSHVRSVSHDSYFEFTLDRRRADERPPAELSTILSEDNDDDDSSSRMDLCSEAVSDTRYTKLHDVTTDDATDLSFMGVGGSGDTTLNDVTTTTERASSLRPPPPSEIRLDSATTSSGLDGPLDTLASESLSLDFEDGPCDIVGDIQKEVADALHWDCAAMAPFRVESPNISAEDSLEDDSKTNFYAPTFNGKVVVERYGSAKTVIVEVHATEDSSADEEPESPGYLPLACAEENVTGPANTRSLFSRAEFSGTTLPNADLCDDLITNYSMAMSDVSGSIPYADSALPTPIEATQQSIAGESPFLFDSLEGGQSQLPPQQPTGLVSNGFPTNSHDDSFLLDSLEPVPPTEHFDEPSPQIISDNAIRMNGGLLNDIESTRIQPVVDNLDSLDGDVASQLTEASVPRVGFGSAADERETTNECVPEIAVYQPEVVTPIDPYHHHVWREDALLVVAAVQPASESPESLDSSPTGSSHLASQEMSPQGLSQNDGDRLSSSDLFGYRILVNEEDSATTPGVATAEDDEHDFSLMQKPLDNSQPASPDAVVTSTEVTSLSGDSLVQQDDNTTFDAVTLAAGDTHSIQVDPEVRHALGLLGSDDQESSPRFDGSPSEPLSLELDHQSVESPLSPMLKSAAVSEKLSPMEESKRRFESEIGRDIMRERKMKLELEKIQLEQTSNHQRGSYSPRSDTTFDDIQFFGESPTSPSVRDSLPPSFATSSLQQELCPKRASEASFGVVELRRPKSCAAEGVGRAPSSLPAELKRASEPLPSTVFHHPGESVAETTVGDVNGAAVSVAVEAKRNSEPPMFTTKSTRPERKASVRELMSKFEKKPKVTVRAGSGGSKESITDVGVGSSTSPTSKRPPLPRPKMATSPVALSLLPSERSSRIDISSSSVSDDHSTASFISDADVGYERLMEADMDSRMSVSLPDSFLLSAGGIAACDTMTDRSLGGDSPADADDESGHQHRYSSQEWTSMNDVTTGGGSSDVARRERIDRYKEERRAQLRNCIRPESFRGDRTGDGGGQSEYLARLKQKSATSPTSTGNRHLDSFDFSVSETTGSPRRRARLSALSLGSPTDGGEDRLETFVSRRRSFNVRSATVVGTGYVPASPTDSQDDLISPLSPVKAPVAPKCSPRKAIVEISSNKPKPADGWQRRTSMKDDAELPLAATTAAMTRSHDSTVLRLSLPVGAAAVDMFGDKKENVGGNRRPSSLATKASGPSSLNQTKKTKSPTVHEGKPPFPPSRERVTVPPKDDVVGRRDSTSRNSKSSPVADKLESPTAAVGGRLDGGRKGGGEPFPPAPRKIKEVAALFEPGNVSHLRKSNAVHGHVTNRYPTPPAVFE